MVMKLLEKIKEDAERISKTIGWKVLNDKLTLEDEEEVIALGNPEIAYNFALNVVGANISKLEDIVVQDPCWSYKFASVVDCRC
jgi:hypothetical protein